MPLSNSTSTENSSNFKISGASKVANGDIRDVLIGTPSEVCKSAGSHNTDSREQAQVIVDVPWYLKEQFVFDLSSYPIKKGLE